MWVVIVVSLLAAEPDRYLGGAAPTPLAGPAPVDARPTGQACSTVTLRRSSPCYFDGRPAVVESDAGKKKQAQANVELAGTVGRGLCAERLATEVLEPKERQRRMSLCTEGTTRASIACGLEGAEVLLDSEGRFGERGRGCYQALAEALQSADVPMLPKEPVVPPARPATPPKPGVQL